MCLTTKIYTKFFGKFVGKDSLGNEYYIREAKRWFGKDKRWVLYAADNHQVANLDPLWFKWLHYLTDQLPMKGEKKAWMLNLGTTDYDKSAIYDSKKERFYKVWIGIKNGKRKN
jgi:NADH:ubiquinone oxidoreductase subunit